LRKVTLLKDQAEAIAAALAELATTELTSLYDMRELRTGLGADITGLHHELKLAITGLRSDLKTDIKDLEIRLTKDINGVRDHLTSRINGILWAVGGVGVLTWILQIFGSSVRQAFHLP
jgi:hypothetical protein